MPDGNNPKKSPAGVHPYQTQAAGYALRNLTGTDLLAFRAVAEEPFLWGTHILDLGCGAGRSTRFLQDLGFKTVGADISPEMIAEAKRQDREDSYHLITRGGPLPFPDASFDGFFSSWMLLEEGSLDIITALMREIHRVLRPGGHGIIISNTPEFYRGSWVSCEVDFPENAPPLRSGQPVRVRLVPEGVELRDFFWSDDDYKKLFHHAGLTVTRAIRPLGRETDQIPWKDELRSAPYIVYQLEHT